MNKIFEKIENSLSIFQFMLCVSVSLFFTIKLLDSTMSEDAKTATIAVALVFMIGQILLTAAKRKTIKVWAVIVPLYAISTIASYAYMHNIVEKEINVNKQETVIPVESTGAFKRASAEYDSELARLERLNAAAESGLGGKYHTRAEKKIKDLDPLREKVRGLAERLNALESTAPRTSAPQHFLEVIPPWVRAMIIAGIAVLLEACTALSCGTVFNINPQPAAEQPEVRKPRETKPAPIHAPNPAPAPQPQPQPQTAPVHLYAATNKPAANPAPVNDHSAVIARIVAGEWGDKPSARQLIKEGVLNDTSARKVFKLMADNNQLVKVNRQWHLVKAT